MIRASSSPTLRPALAEDAASIAAIYNYYILHSIATFEEEPVSSQNMAERLRIVQGFGLPWILAERNGGAVGYAYATRWNERGAYRHSVQTAVYIAHDQAGQGLGSTLYDALYTQLRSMPIHTVIGGISLPNAASVALHEKMGMVKVAHYREVGYKFEKWIDVGYWQLLLDSR